MQYVFITISKLQHFLTSLAKAKVALLQSTSSMAKRVSSKAREDIKNSLNTSLRHHLYDC